MTSLFCTQCGASLIAGAPFCSNCGAITGNAATQPQVPATVAAPGYSAAPGYVAAAAPARAYAPVAGVPKPAGFWIRFVAFIIDYFLVQIVIFPVGVVIGLVSAAGGAATRSDSVQVMSTLISLAFSIGVPWIYDAWMTSSDKQATLGKLALGLKVIDEAGQRISFARATGRYFGKWISFIILGFGYFMAGWTERKRALHDMLAGTYVVYKN